MLKQATGKEKKMKRMDNNSTLGLDHNPNILWLKVKRMPRRIAQKMAANKIISNTERINGRKYDGVEEGQKERIG